MLKFIRKRTKTIVWVVVISFVAWGGYAVSLQFDASGRSPGKIFGKEISFREYQLANQAVQIFYPRPPGAEPPNTEDIEARTWEFLILSREAKRQKIDVPNEELRQEIVRLFSEGKEGFLFHPEAYFRWVKTEMGEEPREFEKQLREQLRIHKLLRKVKSGFGTEGDEEMKRWLAELAVRANAQAYRPAS